MALRLLLAFMLLFVASFGFAQQPRPLVVMQKQKTAGIALVAVGVIVLASSSSHFNGSGGTTSADTAIIPLGLSLVLIGLSGDPSAQPAWMPTVSFHGRGTRLQWTVGRW